MTTRALRDARRAMPSAETSARAGFVLALIGTGIAAADTFGTTSLPGVFAAGGPHRTLARQAR